MDSKPLALACAFTLEAAKSEDKPGACPRFKMVAYTGARMNLGKWQNPVVVDLAGIRAPSQTMPVRMNHDIECGIGHTTEVGVKDGQLVAAGMMSRGTPEAQECVTAAKNGFPWQASIGADSMRVEEVKAGAKAEVNGRTEEGPVDIVRECMLREISLVDAGADGATSVEIAAKKQASGGPAPETEEVPMSDKKNAPDLEGLKALEAAFPADKEFARGQWEKGATVEQAKIAYVDVVQAKLAKSEEDKKSVEAKLAESNTAKAELEKKLEAAQQKPGKPAGAPAAKGSGAAGNAEGPDFMAAARELSRTEKIGMREAIKRLAAEQPELHKAFVAKAAEHPVKLSSVGA
jgi:hypothetical protein